MFDRKELFDFMLDRVKYTQRETGKAEPQAFGLWFVKMYFQNPQDIVVSDGSLDGKIDIVFTTHDGTSVTHYAINTKYTRDYSKLAGNKFYEEVMKFRLAFEDRAKREDYLTQAVTVELRPRYHQLFDAYNRGAAKLLFVTNHRRNDHYAGQIDNDQVEMFHLDELIQYLVDDIDAAMPRTPPLLLTSIHSVLSPDERDTEVPTSIVFAKLVDFLKYMQSDPYDLLFMRNVRVAIGWGKSPVNKAIRETFRDNPTEFAFSHNGITLLCEKQTHDPGTKELRLENPRIVNGSQTLHSIRDILAPAPSARVMVRVIQIPSPRGDDLPEKVRRRKEVISKIAVRSNQQNPIKKWDLVSNDDFQLTLFRFFRQRGYFYERREREWRQRSRQLKSVGIHEGPGIKLIAQLIASYSWNKKKLGPANARQPGDLFEGAAYEEIQRTSPELAYQLWWVWDYVRFSYSELAEQYQYIRYLKGYINLALFAVATKAIQPTGIRWGQPEFTAHLEQHEGYWPSSAWRKFVRGCADHIKTFYDKEAKALYKQEGYEPTYANFFKTPSSVGRITSAPIPAKLAKLAREALES